jgi:hypothetical protein
MKDKSFYIFLHRQIPVFIALSLFPGLGYLLLGWINHILMPALFWYLLVIAESVWGYTLYRNRNFDSMSVLRREQWYRRAAWFFYSGFISQCLPYNHPKDTGVPCQPSSKKYFSSIF